MKQLLGGGAVDREGRLDAKKHPRRPAGRPVDEGRGEVKQEKSRAGNWRWA